MRHVQLTSSCLATCSAQCGRLRPKTIIESSPFRNHPRIIFLVVLPPLFEYREKFSHYRYKLRCKFVVMSCRPGLKSAIYNVFPAFRRRVHRIPIGLVCGGIVVAKNAVISCATDCDWIFLQGDEEWPFRQVFQVSFIEIRILWNFRYGKYLRNDQMIMNINGFFNCILRYLPHS